MKKNETCGEKRFFLVSLGCPKNLVDSEIISGNLLSSGWTLTADPEDASLFVINTCAFIPSARQEAAEEIASAAAWKEAAPGRRIMVSGCLTRYDSRVREEYPCVDFWTGPGDVARVAEIIGGASPAPECAYCHDEKTPMLQLTLPHVAYLKIADGCGNGCAYCIIPRLRGALRSRPAKSVLNEARTLVANGVREIVLVAQDTTVYGADRPGSGETLAGLLAQMDRLDGDFRVRLLYTHPAHYTEELIGALSSCEKVYPYLDIPLQHISDRILSAMNRHITSGEIRALLKKLRARIPGLVLRTTFITGLPGETEEEFRELEDFVREQKFERMGVFPYAAEPGTRAAAMPDQVPAAVAEARAQKLMKAQNARMKRLCGRLAGQEMRVLVDHVEDGVAVARGVWDAPDIDNAILIPHVGKSSVGSWQLVRVVGRQGCDLVAERIRRGAK
ncbi:MAG: 30S ribosomal protein S12 methylthiotransferase RimO [Lentisphaeria bacterium]|nr:30S ribosomal protein S12 methylthiotransferase RimO [Lentisphaeria bacterium]